VYTLDAYHMSLCSMFFKGRSCNLVYDTCHLLDRSMCLFLIFFHVAPPWYLVTDEDFESSPIQCSEGMKFDEGETPKALKTGVNPHH
jgi:hypothetical protein